MGAHAGRLGAKIVSRGKGHSAVSKAAYNARCTLENERLGTRDDYARSNNQCLFSGIYAPAKSPDWTRDREQLWNHVEAFEKRKDAQLARELIIDLPHELTPEQSRWVMQDFIKENFTRKGLVADLAIHAPHQHGDERNIHAHLLIVLRKLDGTEFAAAKTRQTYTENVAELDGWKRSLEQHMNKALTRHGYEARWDLRSNEAKGLDREPEIHLGKAAAALERDGIETAPGNINRQIRERNRDRAAANENDRAEWVREQVAEAEASPLHVLEAVQRERDHAAEIERDELEAENTPQHRGARPVFDKPDYEAERSERLARETRERGDDSASRARHAMEDLARIDPLGTARNFGFQAGDRLKTMQEALQDYARMMRGGISNEQAAAENAGIWKDLDRPTPEPTSAPTPAPLHLDTQSRDQVDDRADYIARQKAAHEEAQRIKAELHAENERRRIASIPQQQPTPEAVREPPPVQQTDLAGTRVAGHSPEAIQRPSYEVEKPAAPAKTPEKDVAAILREFDERFRELPPAPVQEVAPQPVREAEPERTRERTRTPEPPAHAPEIARPSLFQTLAAAVLSWFQPAREADRVSDRQPDAGGDRQAGHVMPAKTPAAEPVQHQPEPGRQQAPEPVRPRPAERFVRSVADEMLAEARAELAAQRARETPQQRAEREAEADKSKGRGDGYGDRTRHRHGLLWELLHPFHDHRRRDHHQP